ncbi:unnamed protein product [Thelazia callipaeda]|uniref:PH domain-containing protein n=1 Tax=Thelazia callipaeda TaxID=103827 RepID=A0A0N5CJ30_THECL|nr:unnamed protein product [Thelazia callipaeda]
MIRKYTRSFSEDKIIRCDQSLLKVCGVLHKWTNFVFGWQKRYFELENGILMYYKSEVEKRYGSRGSVALCIAHIVQTIPQLQESTVDFNRFDVLTDGTSWYLKADNKRTRSLWLRALRYQISKYRRMVSTSQEKNNPQRSLSISGQQMDFSFQSKLLNKIDELKRYNNMIKQQTTRLENLIGLMQDNKENALSTSLLDESLALNAVTFAVLQNINTCVCLLTKQTRFITSNRSLTLYIINITRGLFFFIIDSGAGLYSGILVALVLRIALLLRFIDSIVLIE